MRKTTTEIVNMIMIENKSTGKILVLDRVASSWAGLTFPGGHVEWGESFLASAIREAKEETGLDSNVRMNFNENTVKYSFDVKYRD